jgi:hypothetical protein
LYVQNLGAQVRIRDKEVVGVFITFFVRHAAMGIFIMKVVMTHLQISRKIGSL